MKKSQVAWEWSADVNPVRRRLFVPAHIALPNQSDSCGKQPSEKCNSALVLKEKASRQNTAVAINECLYLSKLTQLGCLFPCLQFDWPECREFTVCLITKIAGICLSTNTVLWGTKTARHPSQHSESERNEKTKRHPVANRDPCTHF